jgi:hypothetical protein
VIISRSQASLCCVWNRGIPEARLVASCCRWWKHVLRREAVRSGGERGIVRWSLGQRAVVLILLVGLLGTAAYAFTISPEQRVDPAAAGFLDIGRDVSGIVHAKPVPVLLTYNKPERLRVGTTTQQQVRIGNPVALLASLEGSDSVIRKKIIASTHLRVQLIGDPDAFNVLPINTDDQVLVNDGAEWNWDITPKRAGQHVLYIRISLRIPASSGNTTEIRDLRPIPLQIQSASNLGYTIVHFGLDNWQFLLTALLLPMFAWIVRAIVRWRKQRQPDQTPDEERKLEAQQSKSLWVPGEPRD